MTISIVLGALGTLLGIWYALLGIRALRHLHHADEIDKAAGWSLWWCLDVARYDDEGRRLCKQGQAIALVAAALWIAAYAIRR